MRRARTISLFLILVLTIIYIANAIIYTALSTALNITSPLVALAVGAAFAVLTASFVVSSWVGTHYYNWFSRAYYTVSATWVGLVFYLLLASLLYSTAVISTGSTLQWLGQLLLAAALLTGVYGALHARNLQIKEVRVRLPNVPAAWRGRRAVWVSDVHLGQIYGPTFARRVVSTINSIPHDIVFIGGDLYDGTGAPDIEELAVPLGQCTASLGTYYVTGNHEEYGNISRFTQAISAAGIKILMDEKVEIDGLQLVGVDYKNASNKERFAEILAHVGIERTMPSILLKHEPRDLDVAERAGISLQISGHTHRAQLWPLEYVARYLYGKFVYGLNTLGTMQVFVSSGTGTWGPPMRVGTDGEVVVFVFE